MRQADLTDTMIMLNIPHIAGGYAMATNKTVATSADVTAFIAAVADEQQRADAHKIAEMMARLSGEPPKLWGPSIIGFGTYHYKYDSGREGEMCRIGFSPRKGQTVIYLIDGYSNRAEQLARLGKHKTGKSCLYIKRLSDIDMGVLEEMIIGSLAYVAEKYPD
jgi:Domain of unknown function (DU1801)